MCSNCFNVNKCVVFANLKDFRMNFKKYEIKSDDSFIHSIIKNDLYLIHIKNNNCCVIKFKWVGMHTYILNNIFKKK
jgi:hypothetical protein